MYKTIKKIWQKYQKIVKKREVAKKIIEKNISIEFVLSSLAQFPSNVILTQNHPSF